jgi:DNA-binding response OmpR family regulator
VIQAGALDYVTKPWNTFELLLRVRRVHERWDLIGQRERLQQVLAAALGRKVVLRGQVRPALLGGLVLRQEGRVYNASLAHHLARLMDQIGATRSGLGLYSDQ